MIVENAVNLELVVHREVRLDCVVLRIRVPEGAGPGPTIALVQLREGDDDAAWGDAKILSYGRLMARDGTVAYVPTRPRAEG